MCTAKTTSSNIQLKQHKSKCLSVFLQTINVWAWKGVMDVGIWCKKLSLCKDLQEWWCFSPAPCNRDCHCTADNSIVNWQQSCWSSCTIVFKLTYTDSVNSASIQSSLVQPVWRLQDVYHGQCQQVMVQTLHVSVFSCLMQRINDVNLLWPFTGEITITLLNQLADGNYCIPSTLTFPPDNVIISARVVIDGRACT